MNGYTPEYAGILKITCKYDEVGGFSDSLSRVKLSGKKGYADFYGNDRL